MQWVCYIEIQGFYAAAARAAGLGKEGRPLAVLRDGRLFDGCGEALAAGAVLGAPAHRLLRDLPQAAQVEWEAIETGAHARAWWDRCVAHTPYVEPVEPHQVFLALPTPGNGFPRSLQREVAALLAEAAAFGFTAFAGVAPSRLVARAAALACRLLHPHGNPQSRFVNQGDEGQFLAPLPLSFLPLPTDVGRRLRQLGLTTIGEAARIAEGEWVRQLGPQGRLVALWSRGIDREPVKPSYPPRQLVERRSFAPEVRDRDRLEQELGRMAVVLARQLAAGGEGCQQLSLQIERNGGPALRAERTLQRLQQDSFAIRQALGQLLKQALDGQVDEWEFSHLTAAAGLIGPMPLQQMELWDDRLRREREERLHRALTLLYERFPSRVVGMGPRSEVSWREQMLQFNDPYRWTQRGA